MMKDLKLEDILPDNCYHVCTNGQDSPIIMRDAEDFRIVQNYLAIAAWKTGAQILAYVIMSNHIHAALTCKDRKSANRFIKLLKQLYSRHLNNKYGIKQALHGIDDSITLIDSIQYLRNCIAYILRNPLCARICTRLEEYRWSSYSCYFAKKHTNKYQTVSSLGTRERRRLLKTRDSLSECSLLIDQEGYIVNESFVRYDIVERLFKNSGKYFIFHLGTCNDSQMEYEMACKPMIRINDTELLLVVEKIISNRFYGKTLPDLDTKARCSMIKHLYFNNKTSIPQLSRVLGLPKSLVSQILSS